MAFVSLALQSFEPALPGAKPRGFAAAGETGAQPGNPLGGFGAILEALVKEIPVVGPLLAEAMGEPEMPATVAGLLAAAPTEPEGTPATTDHAGALADLLAALEASLATGEDPDPALLEELDATLAALGLADASAAAPVTSDIDADNPLEQLAALLGRIVQRFTDSGREAPAKLAELAAAAANPALAPAIMAKLGIEAGAAIAAELAQLMPEAKPVTTPPPPPQQFATPELKTPAIAPAQKTAKADAPPADTVPGSTSKPAAPAESPRPVDPTARAQPAMPQPQPPPEPGSAQPQPQPQAIGIQPATPATIRAMHAAYQQTQPAQQISIPQLAVEIVRHVQAGHSRFEIRIDPPELGRIDVKLDIDGNGTLNARLAVERAETLDLLQRDQRQLERALAQAGLDGSKTNLEFSLKQQQTPFDGQPDTSRWQPGGGDEAVAAADEPADLPVHAYRATASAGGVNIFV